MALSASPSKIIISSPNGARRTSRPTAPLPTRHIGLDAGYVQVTRVSGADPALVITPIGKTPLEAWSYLFEDDETHLSYNSNLFEGLWRWDVYSKALAEEEWGEAEPWNTPTSTTLQPGQSLTHGLRFSLASKIEDIESAVSSNGLPVVTAYPGLIIPTDMTATLEISAPSAVKDLVVQPAGAFAIDDTAENTLVLTPSPTASGESGSSSHMRTANNSLCSTTL